MSRHFCQQGFRWLGVLAVLVAAGCGGSDDRPEIVPVSGVVMYNGNPVAGAQVSFMAPGAPRAATGVTNEKGEFQLSTFDVNDGAVMGEHTIAVSKITGEAAAPPPAMDPRQMTGNPSSLVDNYRQTVGDPRNAQEGPKSELPEKYAKAETSGLKETVTESGPNRFVLQLKD